MRLEDTFSVDEVVRHDAAWFAENAWRFEPSLKTKLARRIRLLPVIRRLRWDRAYVGISGFGLQSYSYTAEITLWRLVWHFRGWNNLIPTAELTAKFYESQRVRRTSARGSANPDLPTRGRYDRHLNIKYRCLAALHGRNPFSTDYYAYKRKF